MGRYCRAVPAAALPGGQYGKNFSRKSRQNLPERRAQTLVTTLFSSSVQPPQGGGNSGLRPILPQHAPPAEQNIPEYISNFLPVCQSKRFISEILWMKRWIFSIRKNILQAFVIMHSKQLDCPFHILVFHSLKDILMLVNASLPGKRIDIGSRQR